MTDTITESFCERCGARYSFPQTAKPRRRGLVRVRVLTRGLTNYVANDGMPMDEAMAAARNDEDRAGISRQLEAFHKTFNFCMSCRQYTCPSCWNEKAGECLTCAPDLTREVLPAPFPDLPLVGPLEAAGPPRDVEAAAAAWPTADLARPSTGDVGEPARDLVPPEVEPARPGAGLAGPLAAEMDELTSVERAEIERALAAALAAEQAAPARASGAGLEPAEEALVPATVEQAVASARGQTRSLLRRFRPGRRAETPDAEPEAELEAVAAAEPEAVAAAEPEAVAAAEPEAVAAAEPEAVAAAEAEAVVAEPEAVVAEPEAADTIEQPTWRVVAPDLPSPPRPARPGVPAWPSVDPGAPAVAGQGPGATASPWASRLATARPEPGSIWAASSLEVLTAPGPAAASGPGPAVQACVSCGLSLSANARFCRRCGTRQS